MILRFYCFYNEKLFKILKDCEIFPSDSYETLIAFYAIIQVLVLLDFSEKGEQEIIEII